MGSVLSTGSTHTIIPVEELPSDEEVLKFGPLIENFELFPQRTSVIWTKVVGPDSLKIRIWERGVGETLGCGTGSSAAAANYLRLQGRGGKVQVENKGGTVSVEASAWDAPLTLEGSAREVFSGSVQA